MAKVRHRASRVPHTMFPCMPGVCDPARCGYALPKRRARCGLPRVRSASAPRTRPISGLSTLPVRSPVNASRTPLPRLAHDSGPAWLAKPSLSETCTPSHCAGLSRHTRTPGVRRGGQRERGTSRRWQPSPARHGSAGNTLWSSGWGVPSSALLTCPWFRHRSRVEKPGVSSSRHPGWTSCAHSLTPHHTLAQA
jgi:hypothetical protein